MPLRDDVRAMATGLDGAGLLRLLDRLEGAKRRVDRVPKGVLFEAVVLRAFELELTADGAPEGLVTWPYQVPVADLTGLTEDRREVEEIDGAVHVQGLSCLCECKSGERDRDVAAIAKLRFRLARRPAGAIGAVFSLHGYTEMARIAATTTAPVNILLWELDHLRRAIDSHRMVWALLAKYRLAVERANPLVDPFV